MRNRAFLPLIAHRAACVILGGVFLWCSVPLIVTAAKAKHFGPVLPFHSTNSYLKTLIKNPAGSEQLMQLMEALPAKEEIAVVYRDGEESDMFLSYAVTYVGSSRVDLQACKLEYSIVSPK